MKNPIIKIILSIVQVLILIPPFLLQYLSNKKMGVMRYLVFKKKIFSEGMFSPEHIYIYKAIIILGLVLCIVLLIYNFNKKIYFAFVKSLICSIVMNLIIILLAFINAFEKLLANYFFLIAFFVIIVLQYIKAFMAYENIDL